MGQQHELRARPDRPLVHLCQGVERRCGKRRPQHAQRHAVARPALLQRVQHRVVVVRGAHDLVAGAERQPQQHRIERLRRVAHQGDFAGRHAHCLGERCAERGVAHLLPDECEPLGREGFQGARLAHQVFDRPSRGGVRPAVVEIHDVGVERVGLADARPERLIPRERPGGRGGAACSDLGVEDVVLPDLGWQGRAEGPGRRDGERSQGAAGAQEEVSAARHVWAPAVSIAHPPCNDRNTIRTAPGGAGRFQGETVDAPTDNLAFVRTGCYPYCSSSW